MLELKKGSFVISYLDKRTSRNHSRKFDSLKESLIFLGKLSSEKYKNVSIKRETNVDHLRGKIADISIDTVAGVTIKTYYDENNEILYCEKCDDDLE